MRISVNGKLVCESKAQYAGKANGAKWDTIKEMSQCNEATPVKKGDKLTIEAIYDLDAHPAYVKPRAYFVDNLLTRKSLVEHMLVEEKPKKWVLPISNLQGHAMRRRRRK